MDQVYHYYQVCHILAKFLLTWLNKIHKRWLQQIECNICCEFGLALMENHFTDWLLWKSCHLSNTGDRLSIKASLQDRCPIHVHVQYACAEINGYDGFNGQSLYWTAGYTFWCEPIYLSAVRIYGTCSEYDFETPPLSEFNTHQITGNHTAYCWGPFY